MGVAGVNHQNNQASHTRCFILEENITMTIQTYWPELVRLVNQGLKTNFYVSLATLNPDGTPHIAPIGSLMLTENCQGYFWEEFPVNTPPEPGTKPGHLYHGHQQRQMVLVKKSV
jgi:hypothetical protein